MMQHADPVLLLLLYGVLPVWLIAGFCDWLCHRASDIETTSGSKESLIHLLMFLEMGIPLLAALLLQVNALILLVMIVLFLCHEATAFWDVSYAVTTRRVSPIEQHIHSFLEMVPLMTLLLVISRHWQQFLSLFGAGTERSDFTLRLRETPLPVGYLVTLMTAIILFEILPYLEEYWRGRRAAQHRATQGDPSG